MGLYGASLLPHVADGVYRAVKEPAYLIVCQPVGQLREMTWSPASVCR